MIIQSSVKWGFVGIRGVINDVGARRKSKGFSVSPYRAKLILTNQRFDKITARLMMICAGRKMMLALRANDVRLRRNEDTGALLHVPKGHIMRKAKIRRIFGFALRGETDFDESKIRQNHRSAHHLPEGHTSFAARQTSFIQTSICAIERDISGDQEIAPTMDCGTTRRGDVLIARTPVVPSNPYLTETLSCNPSPLSHNFFNKPCCHNARHTL